jgi:phosphohistidine swiveling domain-containing protein
MNNFFKNKAETLINLKLKNAKVPKLIKIRFSEYSQYKQKTLNTILKTFSNKKIAIRSSYSNEDTKTSSNAGKYESYLNIKSNDFKNIDLKITQLSKLKKNIIGESFFIQEMAKNVIFSGVVLTRNLVNYTKCININYYDGINTEAVTSGKNKTKSILFFENEKFKIPKKFLNLYLCINEIIILTKEKDLDIEFAVDKNKTVLILQVRKLIVPNNKNNIDINYKKIFFNLEKKINKLKLKHNNLIGDTTYFGNMPDWNPAEIIGTKPRPLALSLYQELITNHIWSQNRLAYGYRDLGQFHLMTTFYGTPYIDVRVDFNSWIPININEKISKKIVNYYLNKFKDNENIQDKIEFEILFTCATFTTKKKLKDELSGILNKKEIMIFYESLKNINLISILKKSEDFASIKLLKKKQYNLKKSKLYEIDKIYWAVEDCKKYGTLPFAGLARCGFVAIDLLNSLLEIGAISEKEKIIFLSTVNTITSEMKMDLHKLSKKNFLIKYGHLRPGTYDITSKNYKDNYNQYFDKKLFKNKFFSNQKNISKKNKFSINSKTKKEIKNLNIYKNSNELFNFIKQSISYREYSKFVFTKSIDFIFENMSIFGKKYGISNDDLSYVKIEKILDMHFNISNYNTIDNLKKHISENKKEYNANKDILLPDVIKSSKNLYIQYKNFEKINFISNKLITTKVIDYNKADIKKNYLGAVCIENADPGYDFLFNKNIKALITKYGGLNSHMAIRCSELNIPALIGVGEKNFTNILKHKVININCIEKKIELI